MPTKRRSSEQVIEVDDSCCFHQDCYGCCDQGCCSSATKQEKNRTRSMVFGRVSMPASPEPTPKSPGNEKMQLTPGIARMMGLNGADLLPDKQPRSAVDRRDQAVRPIGPDLISVSPLATPATPRLVSCPPSCPSSRAQTPRVVRQITQSSTGSATGPTPSRTPSVNITPLTGSIGPEHFAQVSSVARQRSLPAIRVTSRPRDVPPPPPSVRESNEPQDLFTDPPDANNSKKGAPNQSPSDSFRIGQLREELEIDSRIRSDSKPDLLATFDRVFENPINSGIRSTKKGPEREPPRKEFQREREEPMRKEERKLFLS